jgi:hypothetical protein
VRLLDSSDEFTAEVVASATGDFRFFAAPGTWTAACAVARGQRRRQRGTVGRRHPRGRRQGRVRARAEQLRHQTRVGAKRHRPRTRLAAVVLFFEILLVATVVVITWFALYALYRLITDES